MRDISPVEFEWGTGEGVGYKSIFSKYYIPAGKYGVYPKKEFLFVFFYRVFNSENDRPFPKSQVRCGVKSIGMDCVTRAIVKNLPKKKKT